MNSKRASKGADGKRDKNGKREDAARPAVPAGAAAAGGGARKGKGARSAGAAPAPSLPAVAERTTENLADGSEDTISGDDAKEGRAPVPKSAGGAPKTASLAAKDTVTRKAGGAVPGGPAAPLGGKPQAEEPRDTRDVAGSQDVWTPGGVVRSSRRGSQAPAATGVGGSNETLSGKEEGWRKYLFT